MGTDTGGRGRTRTGGRDAQWDFKKASTPRRAPSLPLPRLLLRPWCQAAVTAAAEEGEEGEEGVGERGSGRRTRVVCSICSRVVAAVVVQGADTHS